MTEAGKYVIGRAVWDEGMRGHFIRMFSLTGPQDVEIMVRKIEEEAVADYRASMPYPEDDVREAVAAERERIKAGVEGLEDPRHEPPWFDDDHIVREEVLRIIEGETP